MTNEASLAQFYVPSLQWSSDPSAMRFVFLAGNEGFNQGPVTAETAPALIAELSPSL